MAEFNPSEMPEIHRTSAHGFSIPDLGSIDDRISTSDWHRKAAYRQWAAAEELELRETDHHKFLLDMATMIKVSRGSSISALEAYSLAERLAKNFLKPEETKGVDETLEQLKRQVSDLMQQNEDLARQLRDDPF